MMAMALRAPEGDFRDWQAINAWAEGIARDLGYIAAFEEVLPLWMQPAAATPPAEFSQSYSTIEALPANR
jgi:hypothetical protein